MITYDTLGALIDGEFRLSAHCYAHGCHHSAQLDLEALAQQLGRDHSSMHEDLAPKLRCSACGSRNVGLRLHPSTKSKLV